MFCSHGDLMMHEDILAPFRYILNITEALLTQMGRTRITHELLALTYVRWNSTSSLRDM